MGSAKKYINLSKNKTIKAEQFYKENFTRNKKKIIEIEDTLFYGVEYIKTEIKEVGVFIILVGENNKIIAKKQLINTSKLVVLKNEMTNTYKITFNK